MPRALPALISRFDPQLEFPIRLTDGNAGLPRRPWGAEGMCDHIGVFWADIRTWSGEMVACEGNTYADLPPDIRSELEAIHPWITARRSVWNKSGI